MVVVPFRIENINISSLTVKQILEHLKINKSSVLKETAAEVSQVLARIFNFSFQMRKFLRIWKMANVTTIYQKIGKKSEVNITDQLAC